ncbi:malto-oligosyltrehalose trehalohydrolase [Geminicoccus roseus]|uniref:malto-oligosyltrehalose trehalohydrolase n=1 Tax=Geminicoccus roseus TaxID=404900 RepID=UPI0004172070|nr:malto-oligosyltrehalose trehalohydrolase [Geminicoccus roseus]
MAQTRPSLSRVHNMPHGAEILADGRVRFRLWGPGHTRIELALDDRDPIAMQSGQDGWHELVTHDARAGTRYHFVLPDGLRVPDPASRYQPDDVHGPSEVIDPAAHAWTDGAWQGRPWHEAVIYELHVGTFTEAGTFLAVVDRLDDLVDLGVTAIQLMPLSDFPGKYNWGYDGVLPYAPDSSYGRPEDLKVLVQEAHARGLMVLLDVVYNHFGPEGNYLGTYAPVYFTDRHHTPWGAAVNYDGPSSQPVRDFVLHNAMYWLDEFHLDGLRLDAVHAIIDDSPQHLLDELRGIVGSLSASRHVHLILENEENEARRLGDDVAQWNDDLHHVLHTAATGEGDAYYQEYLGDTEKLGRALAEGFAFQGDMMRYRGHARGESSAHLPPIAFIGFVQNHDQIGNRAFGERLHMLAPDKAVRAVTAACHLAPQVPMLFMGEEWATSRPFTFFCDFSDELGQAVHAGRLKEFSRFPQFADPEVRSRIMHPQAEATFRAAKLAWDERAGSPHRDMLDWYRRLLAARRRLVVPLLPSIRRGGSFTVVGDLAVEVSWTVEGGGSLILAGNFKDSPQAGFTGTDASPFWTEGQVSGGELGPWAICWTHTKAKSS